MKSHNIIKMRIGISLGDPAGIGPEIILKALPLLGPLKNLFIFGNKKLLKKTSHDLHLEGHYQRIKDWIIDCVEYHQFQYGKPDAQTGQIALASLRSALASNLDILITPPIVKDAIKRSIPHFIGHTEYLAHFYGIKEFAMVGYYKNYRLMFLTTHLPLRKVFRYINQQHISKKLTLFHQGLKKYFAIALPRIGVCAINPHGFEFSLGEEERIKQGIIAAGVKGILAEGPYPADTIFKRGFDGILTIYHDQAMIFLKSKKDGLNFTLGLPIIRLSPLYGAALDIAGKNIAEYSGIITAIKQGIKLYQRRKRYEKNYE